MASQIPRVKITNLRYREMFDNNSLVALKFVQYSFQRKPTGDQNWHNWHRETASSGGTVFDIKTYE